MELIVLIIFLLMYMLPTVIAFIRGHTSKWGILIFNFLLGWTMICWIIALIWSVSNKGSNQQVVNIFRD